MTMKNLISHLNGLSRDEFPKGMIIFRNKDTFLDIDKEGSVTVFWENEIDLEDWQVWCPLNADNIYDSLVEHFGWFPTICFLNNLSETAK